jgi:Polyketide cyclase / dehydrase and lipid transport
MGVVGWLFVVVGAILGLLFVVIVTGMLLPKTHLVSRSLMMKAAPDELWPLISDFDNVSTWHPQVIQAERLPDHFGREVWRESYKDGSSLKLETMESLPPRRLVRSIADESGPFTGRWEFDITPAEEGCRLTITEKGEISNPLFRFIFRLFMKPAMSLERYLKSLAAKFGETAMAQDGACQRS